MQNINKNKLKNSRYYAFDSKSSSVEKLVKNCSDTIDRYGFCVIDDVIPTKAITSIRREVLDAQKKIGNNIKIIKKLINSKKFNENQLLKNKKIKLRSIGREGRPSKPVNDIVFMPKFSNYLANSKLVKLARNLLDDHIRIAQLHPKIIPISNPKNSTEISLGEDYFGLPRLYKGPSNARDWHTDWPHDPSASGGDNANENIGFIRQPFPDVTMCLVIIFYLNDVDEKSGGTWAVPGSHKDKRTPRGPSDDIMLTAPISGEIQIKAKAGSVFIQDSRLWHSSPLHNFSNQDRVAVVSRWCPWWLSVDEYAPKSRYNVVCRPVSHLEFLRLPDRLKPLMKHLCFEEKNSIQKPLLKRAKAAADKTRWAHKKLKENQLDLSKANANINVVIPPLKNKNE